MTAPNLISEAHSRHTAREHCLAYGEPHVSLGRDQYHALGRVIQVRGVRGADSYVRDARSPLIWPGLGETVHAALFLLAYLPLPGTAAGETPPPRGTPLLEMLDWTEHRTQDATPFLEVATRLLTLGRQLLDPEQTPAGSLRTRRQHPDEVMRLLEDLAVVAAGTLLTDDDDHAQEAGVRSTVACMVGRPRLILGEYEPSRMALFPVSA